MNVTHDASVSAKRITKSFAERTLWRDLSFEAAAGELTVILGQSGSGKTTLLNCVAGIERIDSGDLVVNGVDVPHLRGSNLRRYLAETVGLLFQNYALVDTWTVGRNLAVVMTEQGAVAENLKSEAVERFLLSPDLLSKRVYSLSGGEQQRVALARLFLKDPAVIIADEPSAALDDVNTEMLTSYLLEKCALGATVLVSTHDPRIIRRSHSRLSLTSTSLEDLALDSASAGSSAP